MDELNTITSLDGYSNTTNLPETTDVMYRKKLIFSIQNLNLNLLSTEQLARMYDASK